MHIYIISFLLTILLIWMAKSKAKSRKIKISLLILAAVPMFLVSALRYNVGTDYGKRYVLDYTMLQNGEEVTNLEIGFKIIDYICLIFTTEPELLFIVTSLIVISLFFEVIYKKSSNPILSVIIFFLGGYFFGTLNLVRQYIAIGFVLLGYQFLTGTNTKKGYILFTMCAVIAFLMHSSSIVCFVIMFLTCKNLINVKWVLPVSILILILNKNIMLVLSPILENTRFNVYLTGKFAKGDLSIITIVENLVIYVLMSVIYYYKKKNNESLDREGITLLNIQGIALLLNVSGVVHTHFMRIMAYFSVFQILSIPYFFNIINYKNLAQKIKNKLNKNITDKAVKTITYICIVIGFTTIFAYTNILNNDNGVLPYTTIFEKENSKPSILLRKG